MDFSGTGSDFPETLRHLLLDFEKRWAASTPAKRPSAKDYEDRLVGPDAARWAAALLGKEQALRRQSGDPELPQEHYLAQFPDIREYLKLALGLQEDVGNATDWHSGSPAPAESFGSSQAGSDQPRPNLSGLDLREHQLCDSLGQGNIGEVYRCLDPGLGRDLALKVLQPKWMGNAEMEWRLEEEARITGSLQHPNIVPVHNLGRLQDGRLFFTMEVVRGQPLAKLLADGSGLDLLWVFEAICQAVAYAHSRGVIHRDLKPDNVMVGEFRRVQVMDWGFAKLLPGRQPATATAGVEVATSRGTGQEGWSQVGDAIGTPAFMAPEQARGEVDELDERCDVFGLGAILCVMLTGQPPCCFRPSEIRKMPSRPDLDEAQARLAALKVDQELIALAQSCLAVEKEDRPSDAGQVAQRVTAYLTSVQQRAQAAIVEGAEAKARADEAVKTKEEGRKKHRWQVRALLLVIALMALGGWVLYDRNNRVIKEREDEIAADNRRRNEEAAALERFLPEYERARSLSGQQRWPEALDAARSALALAGDDRIAPHWRQGAEELVRLSQTEVAEAARDQRFLDRALEVVGFNETALSIRGAFGPAGYDERYAELFRQYGFDLTVAEKRDSFVTHLRSRPAAIRRNFAAALDTWAFGDRTTERPKSPLWPHLTRLAQKIDPDPQRDEIRQILAGQHDNVLLHVAIAPVTKLIPGSAHKRLLALSNQIDLSATPVDTIRLTALALMTVRENDRAIKLLRAACIMRSDEVYLHTTLATVLTLQSPSRWREAIEPLKAVRLRRPEFGGGLAVLLARSGRYEEAKSVCASMSARQPESGWPAAYQALAAALAWKRPEAIAAADRSLKAEPDNPLAHAARAAAAIGLRRFDEAERSARAAVRLDPGSPLTRTVLGAVLLHRGQNDAAESALREAIRLMPALADAHALLASVLQRKGDPVGAERSARLAVRLQPEAPESLVALALLLIEKGHDEAEKLCRRAVALNPDFSEAHAALGTVLADRVTHAEGKNSPAAPDQYREAENAWRRALECDPENAGIRSHLALFLLKAGKGAEAEEQSKKALAQAPDDATIQGHFGDILRGRGKAREARDAYLRALRLRPDDVFFHISLGQVYKKLGDMDKAVAARRRAAELDPTNHMAVALYAFALRDAGKMGDAADVLFKVIRLKPDELGAYENLCKCLEAAGRRGEVKAVARQAVSRKPNTAEEYQVVGTMFLRLNEPASSASVFRAGIKAHPNALELRLDLAEVLRYLWKYNEARKTLLDGAAVETKDYESLVSLGVELHREKQDAVAMRVLRKAIALLGEARTAEERATRANAYSWLGQAASQSGDHPEAVKAYTSMTGDDPGNSLGWVGLGMSLASLEKNEEAIAAYRKAIRLKPDSYLSHRLLGQALLKAAQPLEAIEAFGAVGRLNPKDPYRHTGLGRALVEIGEYEAALLPLREAVRLDRRSPWGTVFLAAALRNLGKPVAEAEQLLKYGAQSPDVTFWLLWEYSRLELNRGDLKQALDWANRAVEAWPNSHPQRAAVVEERERLRKLVSVADKLNDVRTGRFKPDSDDLIVFAELAAAKGHPVTAVRLYNRGRFAKPDIGIPLRPIQRTEAARQALLAVAGKGEEAKGLKNDDRAEFRNLARKWLEADLAVLEAAVADGKPTTRAHVHRVLRSWQLDPAYASIRDRETRAKLPEEEQRAWEKFWEAVEATRRVARERPKK